MRSKSIHTRVTPEEYETIQTLAGDEPMTSEWVRGYLLAQAKRGPLEVEVIRQLKAVRKIVINTVQLATNVDPEVFQALVAEADGGATDAPADGEAFDAPDEPSLFDEVQDDETRA